MKSYPPEIKKYIAEKASGTKPMDLVKMVNDQFGSEFTYPKMRAYLKNNKLRTGTNRGRVKQAPTSLYPTEVREYIRDNYVGCAGNAMADKLNQLFETTYSGKQIRAYYKNNNLNSGLTGRFSKGYEPPNKGVKGIHYSPETEFKKGHTPPNHMPVGAEVVHTDGYLYRKIKEPNVWKQVHRIIWEDANGPIPTGMKLTFLDGDRSHVELKNLMLISNKQNAVMNRRNLRSKFPEITQTGTIIADLYLKMSERKKERVR